jgi:mono/diheme cytochrome c family protein
MNPWLKRGAFGVALLVAAAAAALWMGAQLGDRKRQRVVDVNVTAVPERADAAGLERGRYLYASRGCAECHAATGGGRVFVDEGGLRVRAPNISAGPGSVTTAYRNEDWVRTVRHGVKPDGRPVFVMPSEDYNRWTDADLGALIAYSRRLPAAEGGGLEATIPLPVRALYGYGLIPDAAEKIDHTLPPQQAVPEGVTAEHGAYVATMCIGCHGPALAGGRVPGGPPNWPAAANLTPGEDSAMIRYADPAAFAAMLRSGKRADGTPIAVMPFDALKELNGVDVQALYLHLKSLPPRPQGGR